MFMMITFPWPVPSANVALAELGVSGNRPRAADQQVDDLELIRIGHGIRRLEEARSR